MIQDLFSQADQNARAAAQPATSAEPSFGEAFSSTWEANSRFNSIGAQSANEQDFIQQHLDMVKNRTGEQMFNPYGADDGYRPQRMQELRDQTAKQAKRLNDPSLILPDDGAIAQGGVNLARQAMARSARVNESGGLAAGTGAGLASLAGMATDPINIGAVTISSLVAAPEAAGILASGLRMGLTMGAQQAVSEAATFNYKGQVDPTRGIGDAAAAVGEAAVGGALFGVGGALGEKSVGHALGSALGGAAGGGLFGGVQGAVTGAALPLTGAALGPLWRKLRVESPKIIDSVPQNIVDAGNVAERAADLEANNPFKTGSSGEGAHSEALASAARAMDSESPIELPTNSLRESGIRTGQAFATREASAEEIIDRHAERNNPELFTRADALDSKITDIRSTINDLSAPVSVEPSANPNQARIDEIQSLLADKYATGKRKNSTPASALRDELDQITSANQDNANSVQSDQDRLRASQVQALRENLNGLINDRAKMGPDIFSAREKSRLALQILPFEKEDVTQTRPSHSGNIMNPLEPKAEQPAASAPSETPIKKTRAKKAPAPIMSPTPEPKAVASAQRQAEVRSAAPNTGKTFVGKQAVSLKYELAEAGDLVTSHDNDFRVNPAYPAEMQPRDRAGIPARDQVMSIAQNLQPERLGPNPEANAGAPIVGPDNVVESGNGRAMAVRTAYDMGDQKSGAYRAWLERSGYDTTGMINPLLVGRRVTPMTAEERADFAHAANGSASLRMSATEQALSDARHLSPDVTALHQGGDITAAANREFVRSVVGKMPAGERGGMMDSNGNLSANGAKRLNAAMVARAFGDPDVIARAFDHADPNIKTIASAMVDSARDWLKMRDAVTRGDIPAGQDITGDLMNAVKVIMRQRDAGRPVWEGFMQSDAFQSDTSQLAARLFFKDGEMRSFLSKGKIAENLSTFAKSLETSALSGEDMFGNKPATAKEVLEARIAKSDANVIAMTRAAGDPKAVEMAFDDPKVHAAAEADLRRSIEQGRNRVPVEDDNGGFKLGVADSELLDIENQMKMADEVLACSVPQVEAAE